MAVHKVASVAEIPLGEGKIVTVGTRQIALYNVEGQFYALDNTCPHRGGPLGDGLLNGAVVTCPWHGWQFDCSTGKSTVNPTVKVACYPARVENDAVYLEL